MGLIGFSAENFPVAFRDGSRGFFRVGATSAKVRRCLVADVVGRSALTCGVYWPRAEGLTGKQRTAGRRSLSMNGTLLGCSAQSFKEGAGPFRRLGLSNYNRE